MGLLLCSFMVGPAHQWVARPNGELSSTHAAYALGMKGCLELVLQHPERVERLVLVDTMGFSPLAT
jgi:pimeloyl-ACP methyl ester carboxylesterase